MRFCRLGLVVLEVLALCGLGAPGWGDALQRVPTQSWHGLSGLYVIPTARVTPAGKVAIGYNESKHVEVFS